MTGAISSFPQRAPVAAQGLLSSSPARSKYSCKEYIVLTGVVLAVAGLAVSFFAGANILAAVFSCLTLVTAISFYSIRQLSSLADLARTSNDLIKTQNAFVIVQMEMERLNLDFDVDRAGLVASNNDLRSTTDALNRSNLDLQSIQQEMQSTVTQVTQQNTQLQTANQQLKKETEELQLAMNEIQAQVSQFKSLNAQFSQNEGDFKKNIEVLDAGTLELDRSRVELDQVFDENVQNLTDQIQQGQLVTSKLSDDLKSQNSGLQAEIQRLSTLIEKEDFSQKRMDELRVLEQQKNKEIAAKQEHLSQLAQKGIDAAAKITQQNELLDSVEKKLREDTGKVEGLGKEFARLDEACKISLKQLEAVSTAFEAKVAALKEVAKDLKASELAKRKF